MTKLYDAVYDFWALWIQGEHMTDDSVLQLLALVSTVALIYGVIVLPILRALRGRKK